jgi:uncharacterized cupin superfamily protein
MYNWSAHVSVLAEGFTPHPPHVHEQEEVLLLLSGEADLVVPEAAAAGSGARIRLRAGQFAYYPSRFPHTLQTTSPEAANYLMFRWLNLNSRRRSDELGFGVFDTAPIEPAARAEAPDAPVLAPSADAAPPTAAPPATAVAQAPVAPVAAVQAATAPVARVAAVQAASAPSGPASGPASRLVFEGSTAFLPRFHCHISTLAAGTGYQPHADHYDVAIVLLEGEVETLGQRVEPRAVIAYPAGVAHGMHNPGDTTAKYVVFEFRGAATPYWARAGYLARRLPGRAFRRAGRMLAAHRSGG